MPISKFLIHWTGRDLVKRQSAENLPEDWLVREYAKRLKDNYQNGLFTERKKEKDVLRGLAIDSLVRLCFTEIRLSQAQIHAKRYGGLGIGFSRDFVAARGGRRVLYVPNEPEGGLLERSIKDAWKKSEGNAEIRKHLKWVFAFCKPMSNGKPEDQTNMKITTRRWNGASCTARVWIKAEHSPTQHPIFIESHLNPLM